MHWSDQARAQSGVICRSQLHGHNLSDDRIDGLLGSGALEALVPGVFVVRGAPVGYGAQLWIAILSTRGVLGFATAAHVWGADDKPDAIHVIVGPTRRVKRRDGWRNHHVFTPRSAVTSVDGLPVTTRSWSLLDHLGRLPYRQGLRLADRAIQRGWLTPADICRRLDDYPGRQGNRRLRAIAETTTDGAAAQSERVLHRLLRRAGITGWTANYPVRVHGRIVARLDVAIPNASIAIEVDGFAFHTDVERFQGDRERQNLLVGLGWTVIRFTWHDLQDRPEYVIATIRRHLP